MSITEILDTNVQLSRLVDELTDRVDALEATQAIFASELSDRVSKLEASELSVRVSKLEAVLPITPFD